MNDTKKCENHPDEMVVANCMNCNREICSTCLREYGYFCGEECKEQNKQRTESMVEPEQKEEFAALERIANRFTKIIFHMIVPGVLVLLLFIIIFKVTSNAGTVMWEFRPEKDKPLSGLTSHKGNIYVSCDNGMLYALDSQQGEKWEFKADESLTGTAPVILRDSLCITSDTENSIYAVDTETRRLAWKRTLAGEIAAGPVTGSKAVYYILNFYRELTREELKKQPASFFSLLDFTGDDVIRIRTGLSIYALDYTDGHDMWTKNLGTHGSPDHFTSLENAIYLSQDRKEEGKSGPVLLAIDAESGKGKWKTEPGNSYLFGIHPQKEGILIASDENVHFVSHEGEEIWKQSMETSGLWQPTIAGGKIYFKEGKNRLTCLELITGNRIWTTEVDSAVSQPVVGEQFVFIGGYIKKPVKGSGSKKTKMPQPEAPGIGTEKLLKEFGFQEGERIRIVPILYALDIETGKTVWTKEKTGGKTLLYRDRKIFAVRSSSQFSLLNQEMGSTSQITAVNARNGKILWRYAHKGSVHSAIVEDNRFCFGSFSTTRHISSIFSGKVRKPTDNAIYAISVGR